MRILKGNEEQRAIRYFEKAASVALNSKCLKVKCGSVITHNNKIIGKGWNSPPNDKSIDYCIKEILPEDFKSEKHCCLHAEQRAVMDAMKNYLHLKMFKDTRIYFMRLDKDNNMTKAGKPYCTICSKFVLDNGIKEFALWHKQGIAVYDAEEYNNLSFQISK